MSDHRSIVLMGASAGGVEAFTAIFERLTSPIFVPIVAVLHAHPDTRSLLPLFTTRSSLPIVEAEDGDIPRQGIIYLAPTNYHLLLEANGQFALSVFEWDHYNRPAINPLFVSSTFHYGSFVSAFLFSGANEDGTEGLKAIKDAGGSIYAQNPEEASVDLMPRNAIESISTLTGVVTTGEVVQIIQRLR